MILIFFYEVLQPFIFKKCCSSEMYGQNVNNDSDNKYVPKSQ